MSCEVENRLRVYEIDGKDVPITQARETRFVIESHWNRDRWVIVKLPNGQSWTLDAADIEAAVRNATNTGRR